MADKPFLRKLTLCLPRALWPVPKAYGHAMAFTEDGKVVADLQDPTGAYPETTAITETADRWYVQSLHAMVWAGAAAAMNQGEQAPAQSLHICSTTPASAPKAIIHSGCHLVSM